MPFRQVVSEVLVIGSGGAGLRSAIESQKNGARTVLVCKSSAGYASSTTYSGAGFRAAVGGLSEEAHYQETVRGGKMINDKELLSVLVESAPKIVSELSELGVEIKVERGAIRTIFSQTRMYGLTITQPMLRKAKKLGVKIIENVVIIDLFVKKGRLLGALGYDYKLGEFIVFNIKALVLATGGVGAIFSRSSNPIQICGDGLALAYRASVPLRDMEFTQFFPLATASERFPIYLLPFEDKIYNSKNQNVAEKYGLMERPLAMNSRDKLSIAIMKEIRSPSGPVCIDLRSTSDKTWEDILAKCVKSVLIKQFECNKELVPVAPVFHFFMGGVTIDNLCRTNVEGLFAAGEVVGGLHGANRIGGNAMSEIIVFGAIAGREAARFALGAERRSFDPSNLAQRSYELSNQMRKNSNDDLDHKIVRKELGELMWKNVGVVRTKESLEKALDGIKQYKERKIVVARANDPRDFLGLTEVKNMLDIAEIITSCALYRRESRGAHYREDYPDEGSQKWVSNIFVNRIADDRHRLSLVPVR